MPATSSSPSLSAHPRLRPTHHLKQVKIRHGSRSNASADQAGAQLHEVWFLFHSHGHNSASFPPWLSSGSIDKQFGGNKLSNCSHRPRLGGGGGAPSHQQQFRSILSLSAHLVLSYKFINQY